MSYYDRDRRPRNAQGAPQSWGSETAAGTMNLPPAHYGNTAEFLVSGWPYIKTLEGDGSADFGYVTQWVCVSAIGTDVTITIDGGSATFVVPAGTISPRFDWKCTSIGVTLGTTGNGEKACVSAGLTNVDEDDFPNISQYTGVKEN